MFGVSIEVVEELGDSLSNLSVGEVELFQCNSCAGLTPPCGGQRTSSPVFNGSRDLVYTTLNIVSLTVEITLDLPIPALSN